MKNTLFLVLITSFYFVTNAQDGKPFQTLKAHSAPVKTVCLSPDGNYLISGGDDKRLLVYDMSNYSVVKEFSGNNRLIQTAIFSPEGTNILYSDGNTVKVYTLFGEPVSTIRAASTDVWSIALNTEGNQIVTGSYGKSIKRHNLLKGSEIVEYQGHTKSTLSVDISNDGKIVAGGSLDQSIILWDYETGTQLKTLKGHGGNIYDILFLPQSDYFLSASLDKSVRLWNVNNAKSIKTYIGHEEGVTSLAFLHHGLHFVSGSYDGTLKLWETATGKCMATLNAGSPVNAVDANDSYIVAGMQDNTIKIWKVEANIFLSEKEAMAAEEELSNIASPSEKEKGESKSDYQNRMNQNEKLKSEILHNKMMAYLERLKMIQLPE